MRFRFDGQPINETDTPSGVSISLYLLKHYDFVQFTHEICSLPEAKLKEYIVKHAEQFSVVCRH